MQALLSGNGIVTMAPFIKDGCLVTPVSVGEKVIALIRQRPDEVSKWYNLQDSVVFSGREIKHTINNNGKLVFFLDASIDDFPLAEPEILVQDVCFFGDISNNKYFDPKTGYSFMFPDGGEHILKKCQKTPCFFTGFLTIGSADTININVVSAKKLSPNTTLREIQV